MSLVVMLLLAAGQPLFTEDAWWYLSMGEAYLEHGPWLEEDPVLHTAAGPPAPAAWLSAVALASVERAWSFGGLRLLHVLLVALTLALAWWALRRTSGSRIYASIATAAFAAMSAYRLFQLRPHLFSIVAALVVVWLLVEPRAGPSWWRVAAAAVLCGLWANLHAAFVLGPALIGAAIAGVVLARLWSGDPVAGAVPRLRRLVAAFALTLLATLANPAGWEPHGLYFAAGSGTPDLAIVADEWATLGLLRLPVPNLPPSPLTWALAWTLLALTGGAIMAELRLGGRRAGALDPALIGVAVLSFVALVSAVRFSWLSVFPLLLLGQRIRGRASAPESSRPIVAWGTALAALGMTGSFVLVGAWPMISRGVEFASGSYARPYPATKYYAHAVWFLRDTGLEGNLFNDYSRGNFLGYWLARRMRVFVNGSLNLPQDAMEASHAIARRGWGDDESFLDLLDAYEVDVFFGTGVPEASRPGRPSLSTTAHLENTAGWIPVFRNIRSAVFIRDDPRNRENLERVEAYYERAAVPFDADRGFDTGRVIRESPGWALENGLIPAHFQRLEAAERSFDPARRGAARSQLAAIYLALGLHERAERLDRWQLTTYPPPIAAARRLLWSLMQQGRAEESTRAAAQLEALAPASDALSGLMVSSARRYAELRFEAAGSEAAKRNARALAAATPVFTQQEARQLFTGYREPEARLAQH